MPGRVLPMTLTDAKLIWGPICQTFPLNFKFKKHKNITLSPGNIPPIIKVIITVEVMQHVL